MNGEAACVVSLGAATPVGRSAWASAAAVRAGISGLAQHPFMADSVGEPMVVARAPWLDVSVSGKDRFEALLFPAIDQALQPLLEAPVRMRTALALALPSPRPGLGSDIPDALLGAAKQRYEKVFSAFASFQNGHASGLIALQAAVQRLGHDAFDACVIAGVDSNIAPDTLEWLEQNDQLHGAGRRNNAWGFVPGEASGALLLVREKMAAKWGVSSLARIVGVGSAMEPNRIKTQTICIGEGLTLAFRNALRAVAFGEQITDVYCDMNGEPYRADEYGFTCLRTKEYFRAASDFVAPADCWGDVAAASAPLCMTLAVIAGVKRYSKGSRACVWASSEDGNRAAVILDVNRPE